MLNEINGRVVSKKCNLLKGFLTVTTCIQVWVERDVLFRAFFLFRRGAFSSWFTICWVEWVMFWKWKFEEVEFFVSFRIKFPWTPTRKFYKFWFLFGQSLGRWIWICSHFGFLQILPDVKVVTTVSEPSKVVVVSINLSS